MRVMTFPGIVHRTKQEASAKKNVKRVDNLSYIYELITTYGMQVENLN